MLGGLYVSWTSTSNIIIDWVVVAGLFNIYKPYQISSENFNQERIKKKRKMELCSFLRPAAVVLSLVLVQLLEAQALNQNRTRVVPALLVFGDSLVDPGNNNVLPTVARSNFPPYGRDFLGHKATGRFSNGKIATDVIGSVNLDHSCQIIIRSIKCINCLSLFVFHVCKTCKWGWVTKVTCGKGRIWHV